MNGRRRALAWGGKARWRARRPAGRILLGCVRGQAWQRDSPQWHEARRAASAAGPGTLAALAAAAHFHGVAGYAQRVLSGLEGADGEALEYLERMRAGVLHTHLRVLGDLRLVAEALGGRGLGWLAVKGPVLAGLHGAPDLRAYSDLDLLVPAAAFPDALEALEAAGARPLASNWWHRHDTLAGEVPLALPSGTAVDLHWHLLNARELRSRFPLRMAGLLDRARVVDLGGQQVRTLDATGGLLHLALHTAMSGGNRLVWLKDLERVLLVERPVPSEVAGRAGEARLGLVVATMLERVAATLATPVPAGLPEGLGGSPAWRRVAALARHLPPPERARPGGSVDRLVTRATRTDLRSSAGELARRAARWGGHGSRQPAAPAAAPGGRRGEAAGRGGEAAGRGGEAAGRGGEAAGRRAFLTAVARSQSA